MPTFPSFATSIGSALCVVLIAAGLLWAGCGNDEGELEGDADALRYNIGEPLTDSAYAMIIASEFGADTLTTAEFRTRFDIILTQFPTIEGNVEQSEGVRRTILEDFIMQHLLEGEVDRLELVADTAQVEAQLSQIRSQFPNEEAFQQTLAQEGMTLDSLRASIGEFLRRQMLQERIEEAVGGPTEEEVEAFREEQSEEIRVQHILFLVDPSAEATQDSTVRAEAEAVMDSVQAGVPFGELARRHSDDGTAPQGGDLGYFTRGQMVPPFEEAAFALSDSGDVSPELVKTRFGYHIIRLTGRREGEPMDTTRARQALLQERRQEAIGEELERLRGLVMVRVNPAVVEVDLNGETGALD